MSPHTFWRLAILVSLAGWFIVVLFVVKGCSS